MAHSYTNRTKVETFKRKEEPLSVIEAARLKGLEKFTKWEREGTKLFPALAEDFTLLHSKPSIEFEKLPLFLPSHWTTTHDCVARGFGTITTASDGIPSPSSTEFRLRYGQAHDGLQGVRESIKVFYYGLHFKKVDKLDSHSNTRAMAYVKTLRTARTNQADKHIVRCSTLACALMITQSFNHLVTPNYS